MSDPSTKQKVVVELERDVVNRFVQGSQKAAEELEATLRAALSAQEEKRCGGSGGEAFKKALVTTLAETLKLPADYLDPIVADALVAADCSPEVQEGPGLKARLEERLAAIYEVGSIPDTDDVGAPQDIDGPALWRAVDALQREVAAIDALPPQQQSPALTQEDKERLEEIADRILGDDSAFAPGQDQEDAAFLRNLSKRLLSGTCPRCNGTRRITVEDPDGDHDVPCPDCRLLSGEDGLRLTHEEMQHLLDRCTESTNAPKVNGYSCEVCRVIGAKIEAALSGSPLLSEGVGEDGGGRRLLLAARKLVGEMVPAGTTKRLPDNVTTRELLGDLEHAVAAAPGAPRCEGCGKEVGEDRGPYEPDGIYLCQGCEEPEPDPTQQPGQERDEAALDRSLDAFCDDYNRKQEEKRRAPSEDQEGEDDWPDWVCSHLLVELKRRGISLDRGVVDAIYAVLVALPAPGGEPKAVMTPKAKARVYCTQFAQCKWKGYRVSDRLGVQPDPCPRCGNQVTR